MFIETITKYYEYYHSAVIVTSLLRYIDKAEEASKLKAEAVSDEDMRQMIVDLPGYILQLNRSMDQIITRLVLVNVESFPANVRTTSIQLIGANTFSLYKRYKVAKRIGHTYCRA